MRDVKRALPILIVAILAGAVVIALTVRSHASPQFNYYPETGHIVREPFLTPFNAGGGVEMFGYPISDAYRTQDDTLVQTFQRAQMQLTVRGIELAPIGTRLHLGEPDSAIPIAALLADYYRTHGGADFFGQPLSEAQVEQGWLIQDFERARLVRDSEGNIRLAELGTMYQAAFPAPDTSGRAAIRLSGTPTPPASVRLNLSVDKPTIGVDGVQTIYLYVESGTGQPIDGAQALAVLHYDTATAELVLNPTDERGLSSATFVTPPATPGSRVGVEMHVLVGEVPLTIETAYFQWW